MRSLKLEVAASCFVPTKGNAPLCNADFCFTVMTETANPLEAPIQWQTETPAQDHAWTLFPAFFAAVFSDEARRHWNDNNLKPALWSATPLRCCWYYHWTFGGERNTHVVYLSFRVLTSTLILYSANSVLQMKWCAKGCTTKTGKGAKCRQRQHLFFTQQVL